jgi:hypothetical protein
MEWLEMTAVHISVDRYQPFNPNSGVVYANYQAHIIVKPNTYPEANYYNKAYSQKMSYN